MIESPLAEIFYKEFVDKDRIKMFYNGAVTHNITDAFTSQLEFEFETYNYNKIVKKRVFNIMVEVLQNISKHSAINSKNHNTGYGTFALYNDKKEFVILSANIVNNKQKNILDKDLSVISNTNRIELRELYKNKLIKGRISKKGGAGLGFIDISKRASEKIEFDFIEFKPKQIIFLIKIRVKKF